MREWLYEKMVLLRDFIRQPKDAVNARKEVKRIFKENENQPDKINNWKTYRSSLLNYAIVNPDNAVVTARSLFADKIELKKKVPFENPKAPILVCAVKNDLKRIQNSLEHHKSIGVQNFIFIEFLTYAFFLHNNQWNFFYFLKF